MPQENPDLQHHQSESEDLKQLIPIINENQINYRSYEYIKAHQNQPIIDEEAIMRDFIDQDTRQRPVINIRKTPIYQKRNSKQAPLATQKIDYGLNAIEKKYHTQISNIIQKIKVYISNTKHFYQFKQKENLFELSRYLIIAVYELKDYSQCVGNDITKNEEKIIAPDADIYQWVKRLVEDFDDKFKQYAAKNTKEVIMKNGVEFTTNKSNNVKQKWDMLIKNCKDQTNFELRRKILRKKIIPELILNNDQDFILSQEAKQMKRRELRLILADAQHDQNHLKNISNPKHKDSLISSSNSQKNNFDDDQLIDMPLKMISSLNRMHSHGSASNINQNNINEEKMKEENEKLNEWLQWIGDEPLQRMRNRIEQDLKGIECYNSIMGHFRQTFDYCK